MYKHLLYQSPPRAKWSPLAASAGSKWNPTKLRALPTLKPKDTSQGVGLIDTQFHVPFGKRLHFAMENPP